MRAGDALRGFERAPFAAYDALVGDASLLVLAPHPDDESLGCGGLIAEAASRGAAVRIVVLTDGSKSHPDSAAWPGPKLAALRQTEALAAGAALGLGPDQFAFYGVPDGAAPHEGPAFDAAASRLADDIRLIGAGVVCATWAHDPHGDHGAAHRTAVAACRATGARLLSYPVWGWTLPPETALPGPAALAWRFDIGRHLAAKRAAIAAHRSQTTGLLDDDPKGFRITPEFAAFFTRPFEVYIGAP